MVGLLAALSFANPSSGGTAEELPRCLAEKDDAARLNCFSALLPTVAPATPEEIEKAKLQKWVIKKEVDPLDDSVSILVHVGPADRPSGHQRFVVQCHEKRTSVYVSYDEFVGTTPMPVKFRIDKLPPSSAMWRPSEDGRSLGIWDNGVAVSLGKILLGSERFVLRIEIRGRPVSTVFDISGIERATAPLREECPW